MIRKIAAYLTILLMFCLFFSISERDHQSPLSLSSCYINGIGHALAQEVPIVVWPHEKSDLPPDPAVEFGRFPNGLRYVIMKNSEPKDRVSLHLVILAGSMHETEQERGLAHFLEHMLFNGSTHFPPGELVKYFQKIGMQFGPDANAHTGFFETVYDILLPKGDKESLEGALLVLQDYAQGALLLPSEIERERNVVLAEKRTRDSASYRTFESSFKFELPDVRLSRRLPIGLESVITHADQNLFKGFYDAWYRPDNLIVVIVGDCNTKTAGKLVSKYFSAMAPRTETRPLPPFGDIHHKGIKPFYHYEKEAGNTSISIEIVEKKPPLPDSFAFQKEMLINNLGNMIVQNRLNAMVNKPETPFTKASVTSGIYLQQLDYADVSAECSPENWEKTLSLLEQTLRAALDFGFTQTEFERVKKEVLSLLETDVKSASTRDSRHLSNQIAASLINDRVFQSPEQKEKQFKPILNTLTVEKVYEAFKATWSPVSRLILVTGNAAIQKDPEQKILDIFNASRNTTVERPKENVLVSFPYLPEPETPGPVLRKQEIPDLGIIQVDFKNNLRLNLKKTDFKVNEVLFKLSFGKGRFKEPADNPGLAILSSQLINESGLGGLTKEELEYALTGKNTQISFGVDEYQCVLKGTSVPDETTLLFQLLYAYIKDMEFRDDAYTLVMERLKQNHTAMTHTIEGVMQLKAQSFLAGGDTRFGFPDYDTLKQSTLQDIRSWVTFMLQNSDFELSIVGDIDPATVIAQAAKYLGSLPLPGKKKLPETSRQPVFPKGKSLTLKVPTKIDKGIIDVVYPTEDFWNIQRTRRLIILGEIFTERLRVIIREKMGASYSFYAYNRASKAYKGYGLFHAVVQMDPAQTDLVLKNILQIASSIKSNGITQDEFRRTLDPVLTNLKDMRRTNSYWLNSVLCDSKDHPVQLEWSRTIMDDFAAITENELVDLAKTYLDNKKAATIILNPEK